MEGVTSIIAGMFGTGTGATTISDNVHLIAVTRMGSRAAVMVGAGLLIFFSLFGQPPSPSDLPQNHPPQVTLFLRCTSCPQSRMACF